ncbi:MAG: SH3 domain-containing protein [Pseudomonadota bacterium]
MRKQQLLGTAAWAAALFVMQPAMPAFAEDQEFQCSTGYRIFLPDPGPNGVIQTSSMFDRMIFERDGLWLHDDTDIQFELIGENPLLVVNGQEITCQQVPQAIVTTVVEPATSRAAPLQSDLARVAPEQPPTDKADRVAPQTVQSVEAPAETQAAEPPTVTASLEVQETPAPAPIVDDATTTGSLVIVPDENNATAAEEPPALTGQSRGGRLRSGPGTDFAIAGALDEGAPVTILENVGNTYRGYDWFEIEYGDGQKAFTWGGILCSDGQQADGLFEMCS